MFSPEALANEITKQLNEGNIIIPEGHKVAFVTHADLNSVSGAFAYKFKDSWQVGTLVDWSHAKGVDAGFSLSWSK